MQVTVTKRTLRTPGSGIGVGAKVRPTRATKRLGDRVEFALTSVGVTKERWQAVKASLNLPPTCRCEARQKWLNKLDESLGLGEKLADFTKAIGWSK